jgi:hypothetical protein
MTERPPPRHLRIEQSPLERVRLWVEIAALFAAGCWAVYTFVYQTRIAPLFLPPHEIVTTSAQRVGETPENYLERIDVTLHNDGNVETDAAAFAVTVFGTSAENGLRLHSSAVLPEMTYREIPENAWTPLGAHGLLLAGAVGGKNLHEVLGPGDSIPLQWLVVVPRKYRVMLVRFQMSFGRFPIRPPVKAQLQDDGGALTLKGRGNFMDNETYFGV